MIRHAAPSLAAVALLCGHAAGDMGTSLSLRGDPAASEPAVPQASDSLKIQIEPLLWFVGPSGKFKLPVTSGNGPGAFATEADKVRVNDVGLSSTRLSPAGTLTVSTGPWRFSFSGSDFELSQGNAVADVAGRLGSIPFAKGDVLKMDMSLGVYDVSAGYRVWEHDFRSSGAAKDAAVNAFIFVHAFVGARFYDVDISAESLSGAGAGARAEEAHVFAEPVAGARAEAVIADDFSLMLQLSAGGLPLYSTSSYSLDIVLAFEWRPIPNVGIELGWRQVAFGLTDGKNLDRFQYNGRLAGLFTGVVIRF